MKSANECRRKLQGRFSACKHYMAGGKGCNGIRNFILRHFLESFMRSVTKSAVKVATGETDEHGRCTGKVPFALEGIENLIYFHVFNPHP